MTVSTTAPNLNRVKSIEIVPSNMAVLLPLLRLLQLPPDEVDVDEVVRLVSYDNSIAAQCLRVAASPLFGLAQPPESVSRAVMLLGLRRVQSILLTCCMGRALPVKNWVIDSTAYWRHCLGCAMVCRKFASKLHGVDGELAYTAGLLHDIGLLVNCIVFPTEFAAAFARAKHDGIPLPDAELEVMGFSHCESGAVLAAHWKLGEDIVDVVAHHHSFESARKARSLVAIVHLCDLLCRMRDLGYGYYESVKVDLVAEPAWGVLFQEHSELAGIDIVQFTFELDEAIQEIAELVHLILGAAPARA